MLRKLAITRATQARTQYAAYAPMTRGFVDPNAVVDVACRRVLVHRSGITLEAIQAKEVSKRSVAKHGTLEIVNTAQGSQFTAEEFTRVMLDVGCKLSMDGRSAWRRDNVFVERLCHGVKYERAYLEAYNSVSGARADIANCLGWDNTYRSHSSWERAAPNE